jgi:hypothetical protein
MITIEDPRQNKEFYIHPEQVKEITIQNSLTNEKASMLYVEKLNGDIDGYFIEQTVDDLYKLLKDNNIKVRKT